jgi:uncharacterized protein YceH (UPF0502 family)
LELLNDVEVRVLGSLIEKEITTPDYYPLSLNALTNACNQSSNRNPVVHFEEQDVLRATETLRQKGLLHVVDQADSRVTKYRQVMPSKLDLDIPQVAVISVLMLRGPQTVGELRTRSNRIHEFPSLDDVETTLNSLMTRQPALVVRLPRQTGHKEVRYAHLLSGDVVVDGGVNLESAPTAASTGDRVAKLEQTAEELRQEVERLKQQFDQFKKQFE